MHTHHNALPASRYAGRASLFFTEKDDIVMLTCKILIAAAIMSALAGAGIVLAETETTSIGIIIAALGSLITAIVGGIITVMNTKTKNRIEEMKVTMEAQRELSRTNNTALNNIHSAITDNTIKTVESTAATDQVKQRVEQLADRLPGR